MRRAVILALVACSAASAKPPPDAGAGAPPALAIDIAPPPSPGELLAPSLIGDDARLRRGAIDTIARLSVKGALTADDGVALLREVPRMPPAETPDPQATAIDAIVLDPRPEYAPVLAAIADALRPPARERALVALANAGDPAVADLVARHAGEDHAELFVALDAAPKRATVDALAPLIARPELAGSVAGIVRDACDRGVVAAKDLAPAAPALVDAYRAHVAPLALLDAFACLPRAAVAADLAAAVASDDPDTALAAAATLGTRLPHAALVRLAADDRTRARLFAIVGRRRMPKDARTQDALARSLVVDALGADQVTPAGTATFTLDDGTVLDHYLFHAHVPGRGTVDAAAGPFVHADEPTVDDHGGTGVGAPDRDADAALFSDD